MPRCLARAALLVTFVAATPARAGGLATAVPPSATSVAAPGAPDPTPTAPRKDPRVALALSLGATVGVTLMIPAFAGNASEGSLVALGVGLLVAPSVGHWYSGRWVNPAMIVRGVALTTTLVSGMSLATGILDCSAGAVTYNHESGGDDGAACDMAVIGAFTGAAVYGVAAIYEIADARYAAREHNRRHGWDVQVVPTAMRGPAGTAPGLSLSGRF
jgi:hypothetical protein